MSFTKIDSVSCGPDAEFAVGKDRHGHVAVFDGAGGLETTIRFNQVHLGRTIEFARQRQKEGSALSFTTGSIEAVPRIARLLQSALEDERDVVVFEEEDSVLGGEA